MSELAARLPGELVLPDEPAYLVLSFCWNLAVPRCG